MVGLQVFLLCVLTVFLLWTAISPRGAWKVTRSWRYRDPKANEPSDTAYAVTRVASIVTLVFIAAFGLFLLANRDQIGMNQNDTQRENDLEQENDPAAYESCLSDYKDRWNSDQDVVSPEEFCEVHSPSPG